jgi:hypothetical protein
VLHAAPAQLDERLVAHQHVDAVQDERDVVEVQVLHPTPADLEELVRDEIQVGDEDDVGARGVTVGRVLARDVRGDGVVGAGGVARSLVWHEPDAEEALRHDLAVVDGARHRAGPDDGLEVELRVAQLLERAREEEHHFLQAARGRKRVVEGFAVLVAAAHEHHLGR